MTDELKINPATGQPIYEINDLVLADFMRSTKAVQIIQGPVGSGKSKACNMKVGLIAAQQKRGPDGYRRTRWGVVRNTYPELKTTTIRTWLDTYPENIHGRLVYAQPPRQTITIGDVVMEVDFLALDKAEDVKKLRSGEYTGFYINELQYLPKELFDEATSRAGRYPAIKDGGPTWNGVIADMNAPDEDHFIAMMTGQTDYPENTPEDERLAFPEEWDFFMQPPALLERPGATGGIEYVPNPKAENLRWLPKGYYINQIKGKTRAWIKSRVLNQIALVIDGDPVWPGFREDVHVAKEVLRASDLYELWVGLDFGRRPAAVFGQSVNNRMLVLAELQGFNEGAVSFAPKVKRFIQQRFPNIKIEKVKFVGDPKGQDKTQTDERTAYDVFAANGMDVRAAPVKQNNIQTRIQAVESILNEMYDGRPRFLVSPSCRSLKVGMAGRYCYKKKQGSTETHNEPFKDRYSDLADALQYLALGMGEGSRMVGRDPARAAKPISYSRQRSLRRVS